MRFIVVAVGSSEALSWLVLFLRAAPIVAASIRFSPSPDA
jgi:hypothetical protein